MKSRCLTFLALLTVLASAPAAFAQLPGLTGIDLGPNPGGANGSNPLPGRSFEEDGAWIVWGGGDDIWNQADAFHYEYQAWSGGFDAEVRALSLEPTNDWAKVGIMARAALTPGSAHGFSAATPSNGSGMVQGRPNADGGSIYWGNGGPNLTADGFTPIWLRMQRWENGVLTSWAADDGAGGHLPWSEPSLGVFTLPTEVLVGLALTSHDQYRVTEAALDHYSIKPLTANPGIVPMANWTAANDPAAQPEGGAGYFAVREVINNGGNMHLAYNQVASLKLASGDYPNPGDPASGTILDYTAGMINIHDSDQNGHFGADAHFGVTRADLYPDPATPPMTYGNVDQLSLVAKGTVKIPATDDYTFNVTSDDGFRLSIDGKYVGNFEDGRGAGDTFMPVHLTAGKHSIQLTYGEGGGGSSVELTASRGVKTAFDGDFRLVGAPEIIVPKGIPGGHMAPLEGDPTKFFNITEVHKFDNTTFGGDASAMFAAVARLDLPEPDDLVYTGTSVTVNYKDPENAGAAGEFGTASRAPILGNTAGDDDNYAQRATGILRITAADVAAGDGKFTFGVHTDDGFRLSIAGANFESNVGGELYDADFDGTMETLTFPAPTGDSNTLGHVTLAAGDYPLIFDWYENGGGSFAELSSTVGYKDLFDHTFTLLGGTPRDEIIFPAGLELVAPGQTYVAGDVDMNGTVDIFDVAKLQTKYGMASGATWADGDFDGNGTVDIFDVAKMQVNYGYGVGGSPSPVPEPSTLLLAGLGLIALVACGRRRRKEA
ncbi:MAG: PA14 domain-containing protein [Pirellulales bacterium]